MSSRHCILEPYGKWHETIFIYVLLTKKDYHAILSQMIYLYCNKSFKNHQQMKHLEGRKPVLHVTKCRFITFIFSLTFDIYFSDDVLKCLLVIPTPQFVDREEQRGYSCKLPSYFMFNIALFSV